MWLVYFIHGVIYHYSVQCMVLFDTFCAYADIAEANDCFIDELDPEYVFTEVDKRLLEEKDND